MTHLLVPCYMLVFQNATHGPSTESALCDIQKLFYHCIEYELIMHFSQSQAALHSIVAKLVKKERWDVWFKMSTNEMDL